MKTRSEYSVSVIVPLYNERDLVSDSITHIHGFLTEHFSRFEILIVESGSTDGSAELCAEVAQSLPNIRVIHEGARNGFGSALKLGYSQARMDLSWLLTVDLPFPLESILEALPHFETNDAVLSYRSIDTRPSMFRKVQSFVYNNLIKIVLGLKVKHINSGFKVYKTQLIQKIPIITNGWLLDAEVITWITRNKIAYTEIPVALIDRTTGESSVGYGAAFQVLKDLFYYMRHRPQ